MTELEGQRAHKYEMAAEVTPAPCYHCGHEAEDHGQVNHNNPDIGLPDELFPDCTLCDCPEYLEPDAQEMADDARISRWEADHGR